MKKNFHPQVQTVKFTCSSCMNQVETLSTLTNREVTIEICSKCHPFYLGKSTMGKVTGKAEKLMQKFHTGKATATTKVAKVVKKPTKPAKTKATLADIKF